MESLTLLEVALPSPGAHMTNLPTLGILGDIHHYVSHSNVHPNKKMKCFQKQDGGRGALWHKFAIPNLCCTIVDCKFQATV